MTAAPAENVKKVSINEETKVVIIPPLPIEAATVSETEVKVTIEPTKRRCFVSNLCCCFQRCFVNCNRGLHQGISAPPTTPKKDADDAKSCVPEQDPKPVA